MMIHTGIYELHKKPHPETPDREHGEKWWEEKTKRKEEKEIISGMSDSTMHN